MVQSRISAPAGFWLRMRSWMDNFRGAVLATIAFVAMLLFGLAALVIVYDASEKAMAVIGIVVTGLFGLIGNVIVYLKIDGVESKADDAAVKAASAAQRIEAVHNDVLNGPLRDNVKKAISEDRHALRNREAAEYARAQMEERVRRREAGGSDDR